MALASAAPSFLACSCSVSVRLLLTAKPVTSLGLKTLSMVSMFSTVWVWLPPPVANAAMGLPANLSLMKYISVSRVSVGPLIRLKYAGEPNAMASAWVASCGVMSVTAFTSVVVFGVFAPCAICSAIFCVLPVLV